MQINKDIFFKSTTIFLISVSFFLGYFFRENATGGGLEFYKLSWPIIQSFREDFLFTIYNYATPPLKDGTIPFSHIINAYLNPFSDNTANFQLSVTVISFLIFVIFAIILKKIFSNISFLDSSLISSSFLILPFFRTSAFWGKNENYGWLFLILALYFFSEIKKNLSRAPNKKDIVNVLLFCLTSAAALYARQALIFLPISYLTYLFFYKAHKKIIITSIISFILLAVPGLVLIFIWRDIYNAQEVFLPIGLRGDWLHPKYIMVNFPILLSFFGFYLLPILVIDFFNCEFKVFYKKYFKSFIFSLIFFIILWQMNVLNYLGNYVLGGGAILKINYIIYKNNFLLLIIFSSIGFSILVEIFKENFKNNAIIILPIFIIYGFTHLLYQEYLEPLILIIFFLVLKTNLHNIYLKNIKLSHTVFLSYFAIYLIGSIYFKHIAFSSFDEWQIFLNNQ